MLEATIKKFLLSVSQINVYLTNYNIVRIRHGNEMCMEKALY